MPRPVAHQRPYSQISVSVSSREPGFMFRGPIVLLGALLFMLFSTAWAYEQWIVLPNGQQAVVDWGNGQLRSTGQAVPPLNATTEGQQRLLARRGAILDGQRNLLESLGGVYITSDTTMLNLMANDVVRSSVEGVVAGAVVTAEEWDADAGIYTVWMEIPLQTVRNAALADKKLTITIPPTPTEDTPTGLILDLGGLGAVPALTFRISTLDGFEITSVGQAFYYVASAAGYAAALESAKSDARVASSPLVIRGLALDANGIDILISDSDGALLAMYLNQLDFFGDGRTLVVMY